MQEPAAASQDYESPIFKFDEAAHEAALQEAHDMRAQLDGRPVRPALARLPLLKRTSPGATAEPRMRSRRS